MAEKISSNSDYSSSNEGDRISEAKKLEENLSKPENAARKPKRKGLILISERIFDSQRSFSRDVGTD